MRSIAAEMNGNHPLQSRLEKWNETQLEFKLDGYRRTYGAGEPIRRAMELQIVKDTSVLPKIVTGPSRPLHLDILEGRDDAVDWDEVYTGPESTLDFHSELEKRMNV
ncbi:Ump1p [Sugiyamaella lignohabitans]|uniref:Ump1p n=1 Tax=Sugiyamaella lignohabitans TaxID=796027 RepID=A0A167ED02_9ASCO|nr:Ump1p [Sugiyamaella lignohabitans]ANB13920.1 Ump1p [Sugiyamaella lignohabitans]